MRASGFQSDQFRQIEFMLGKKSRRNRRALSGRKPRAYCAGGTPCEARPLGDVSTLPERRGTPRCRTRFWSGSVTLSIEAHTGVQDVILRGLYRDDPKNAQLCERLVDLDEGIQEWRYRHVKMVQRTIGMKMGTGGSGGASYLMQSLLTPLFPDLWEIRTRL